jgi:uncharacterized protein involved in exopolysaccharide biosynthesis
MAESTFPIIGAQVEKDQSIIIQAYLKDFLDLIVRRKWLIIFFILLGISVGVGLCVSIKYGHFS